MNNWKSKERKRRTQFSNKFKIIKTHVEWTIKLDVKKWSGCIWMIIDYQFSAYSILDKQRDPTSAGETREVEIGDGNWGGKKDV